MQVWPLRAYALLSKITVVMHASTVHPTSARACFPWEIFFAYLYILHILNYGFPRQPRFLGMSGKEYFQFP